MKRRIIGLAVAACTAILAMPAASQADPVDTRCNNGKNPVHYSVTDLSPVIKADVRLLCIRD